LLIKQRRIIATIGEKSTGSSRVNSSLKRSFLIGEITGSVTVLRKDIIILFSPSGSQDKSDLITIKTQIMLISQYTAVIA
jgi:hypothetical protein